MTPATVLPMPAPPALQENTPSGEEDAELFLPTPLIYSYSSSNSDDDASSETSSKTSIDSDLDPYFDDDDDVHIPDLHAPVINLHDHHYPAEDPPVPLSNYSPEPLWPFNRSKTTVMLSRGLAREVPSITTCPHLLHQETPSFPSRPTDENPLGHFISEIDKGIRDALSSVHVPPDGKLQTTFMMAGDDMVDDAPSHSYGTLMPTIKKSLGGGVASSTRGL